MGYKHQRKVYLLRFGEDHDLHGLEVRARAMSLGTLVDMTTLAVELKQLRGAPGPEDMPKVVRLFDVLGEHLVSWNLEDDADQPVPATRAGLDTAGLDLILPLILAWMQVQTQVAPPLGAPSSAGVPSVAGSIPMEPLSSPRAS